MRVAIAPSLSYLRQFGCVSGGLLPIAKALYRHLPECGIEVTEDPERADVFHSYSTGQWFPATVYTNEGMFREPYKFEHAWQGPCHKAICGQLETAKAVTAPSEFCAGLCRPWRRDIEVVRKGIEFDEWQPGETQPYVLWAKSSLVVYRAYEAWQKAAAVASLASDVEFVFTVWDGKVPRPDNVKVIGSLPFEEIVPWMRNAAAYLLTTEEPGACQPLEAMACGVPVAGLPIGCNPEYVRSGTDGLLWDDLTEAIHEVLAKRDWYGRNARERASGFQWRDIIPRYAELYRTFATEKPEPALPSPPPAAKAETALPSPLPEVAILGSPPMAQARDDGIIKWPGERQRGDMSERLKSVLDRRAGMRRKGL